MYITLIKSFITLAQGGKHKYCGNLPQYFNPRISRVKITMVIYRRFFTLAPGANMGPQYFCSFYLAYNNKIDKTQQPPKLDKEINTDLESFEF
jgi:hypothetical protein